jgi:ComF family protein
VIVEKLKYGGHMEYGRYMADRMLAVIMTEYSDVQFEAVVPVPLHPVRRRERGFNQSEIIARQIAQALAIPVQSGQVRRARPTVTQTRLNRAQRRRNMKDAFVATEANGLKLSAVLLVDDVYTTGSTMNECARALTDSGRAESVYGIAFARACL